MPPKKIPEGLLKISNLANLTGVSTRTIRFYVEEGFLPPPIKTNRNMSYYHPDCIYKIKAIKKAQKERFLPLEAIGRILQDNNFDFSTLDRAHIPSQETESALNSKNWDKVPKHLIKKLFHRDWIASNAIDNLTGPEKLFIDYVHTCLNRGTKENLIINFFERLESVVEKITEEEFKIFLSSLPNNSPDEFESFLDNERRVVNEFIWKIRDRSLKSFLKSKKNILDDAAIAGIDEGYGIPMEAVGQDLHKIKAHIHRNPSDVQAMIDLSTGYSCVGDHEKALSFLEKAMKLESKNIGAKVRWFWYKRLSSSAQDSSIWRNGLAKIVEDNPDYITGHLFLAICCAYESLDAMDPSEGLRLINQCITELNQAEQVKTTDLHQWAMLKNCSGVIYSYILAGVGEIELGIESFETLLSNRSKLDTYYAKRLPFFPKWLWPNVLYFLGMARLKTGDYHQAYESFQELDKWEVSSLLRKRVAKGLSLAEKGKKEIKNLSS